MKLILTPYEHDQFTVARQTIAELNASLAGRGAGFRFAVTLAGKGESLDGHLVVTDACGST